MIGYWISFGLIALLIPVGIFTFIGWGATKMDPKPTKEQYAVAGARGFYYTFFYWLCDLFYMSCFINNLICKYIFGGLILVIIFVNLARSFTSPKEKKAFDRFGMIQDFLVGTGLTIYLIYIVPNEEIRTIVIAVIAAVYGGFIGLVGVGWTIRKSDKDRKEDEAKKARPIFSYNMLRQEPTLDVVVQKICLANALEKDVYKCEVNVELENSNLSPFEIKRIHHDNAWVEMEGNTMVLPGAKCLLNFRFTDNPLHLFMEVEDLLKNKHYYQLKILFLGTNSSSGKLLHTVREISEISETEMNKLIKEEPKYE